MGLDGLECAGGGVGDSGRDNGLPCIEVRDDGEERLSLILCMRVKVVLFHDSFRVTSLKGGVSHAPVKGDMVADE